MSFLQKIADEIGGKTDAYRSPSITNIWNIDDNLLYYLLLFKLAKSGPEGQKQVAKILENSVEGVNKAMVAMCSVARGDDNHIGEYGALRLMSLWLERLGMITTAQAQRYSLELAAIAVADIGEDVSANVLTSLGGIFKGLGDVIPAIAGLG